MDYGYSGEVKMETTSKFIKTMEYKRIKYIAKKDKNAVWALKNAICKNTIM